MERFDLEREAQHSGIPYVLRSQDSKGYGYVVGLLFHVVLVLEYLSGYAVRHADGIMCNTSSGARSLFLESHMFDVKLVLVQKNQLWQVGANEAQRHRLSR